MAHLDLDYILVHDLKFEIFKQVLRRGWGGIGGGVAGGGWGGGGRRRWGEGKRGEGGGGGGGVLLDIECEIDHFNNFEEYVSACWSVDSW